MGYVIFYPEYFDTVDLDILQYLSNGLTLQQISDKLFMDKTNRDPYHLNQIQDRLNILKGILSCQTNEQLIATVIRNHIIF